MQRIVAAGIAVVVVLLVASQFLLPALAERAVAGRLTKDGGSADVSVSAFPGLRLLFGHGDSLKVDGSGITLPEKGTKGSFDRLDKFEEVRIDLRDVTAGPLEVRRFNLARSKGAEGYSTAIAARTTPRELATYLGGPLGALAAGAALGPGSSAPLPVELTATVESRDGKREVTQARGSVGGFPAGPLVELVLDAVVRRL